jgi:hypothetical protein
MLEEKTSKNRLAKLSAVVMYDGVDWCTSRPTSSVAGGGAYR